MATTTAKNLNPGDTIQANGGEWEVAYVLPSLNNHGHVNVTLSTGDTTGYHEDATVIIK